MATTQELLKFHSEDYVNFLSRVSPDAGRSVANNLQKFNVGEYTDCPIFDGMVEFCKLYTGCSIGALRASVRLSHGVDWSGVPRRLTVSLLTLDRTNTQTGRRS